MNRTDLGCFFINQKIIKDQRGSFEEVYKESSFLHELMKNEPGELHLPRIKQVNVARSKANVVRGFHLQLRKPQGKLIRVLDGSAIACILDVRPGSLFYGQTECFELNEHTALYVPPGFANSYWATSDVIYQYCCTEEWDQQSDTGICPLDKDISTPWSGRDVLISEKDKSLPSLKDFVSTFIEE